MKLLKKKPKLIVEFEDAKDGKGFYLTFKTEGDMCDEYVMAAANYLNKIIKAGLDKKNGKNRRK